MAFAAELIRQGIRGLTISQCVGAMDADLLVGAGAVERIIYGGGSLDRFGRLACVNRGIEDGSLVAEESAAFPWLSATWPGLGLPFMPIRSLRGSDLLQQLERGAAATCQRGRSLHGRELAGAQAVPPDVAVVQVQAAMRKATPGSRGRNGTTWSRPRPANAPSSSPSALCRRSYPPAPAEDRHPRPVGVHAVESLRGAPHLRLRRV